MKRIEPFPVSESRTDHETLEAEGALLGCALNAPKLVWPMIESAHIGVETFSDLRHRKIFLTIRELNLKEKQADLIAVSDKLLADLELNEIGGLHFLQNLDKLVPGRGEDFAPGYIESLLEKRKERQLSDTAHQILNALNDPSIPRELIISGAEKALRSIHISDGSKNGLTIRTPDELLAMEFDDSDRIIGDRLLASGQSLTLLLQLAVCCISGKRFLKFETNGENLKWLFVQGENSNRRLQFDLANLKPLAGPDWPRVNDQLTIHTLESDADIFLSLDDPNAVGRLQNLVAEHLPDIVVFDTLNCFAIGDSNSDRDMRDTCQAITRIVKAGNPGRAIIVLHHALTGKAGALKATGYDRAGFGRNSKVLQAWTRGAINITPGSPDSNDLLVFSCGKCSNGREFETFAARLNPVSMIYESDSSFDLKAWEADMSGRKSEGPAVTLDIVRGLCRGSMSKAQLVKAIMEECGVGKTIAYRKIQQAEQSKKIHRSKFNDTYVSA